MVNAVPYAFNHSTFFNHRYKNKYRKWQNMDAFTDLELCKLCIYFGLKKTSPHFRNLSGLEIV